MDQETKKYPADFHKIGDLQKGPTLTASSAATSKNIDAAFEALISKAKAGDKIEILVSAHGADSCGELGPYFKNDLDSHCKHQFVIFDERGNEVLYDGDKVLRYLKKMEAKGALPVFNRKSGTKRKVSCRKSAALSSSFLKTPNPLKTLARGLYENNRLAHNPDSVAWRFRQESFRGRKAIPKKGQVVSLY